MTGYAASVRPRTRADGTTAFDVRFRLDGRSRSISFETIQAANRWATILRHIGPAKALDAIGNGRTSGSTPTVDEWADTYIRGLSGREGKTIDHYRLYMRVSISPTLGSLPLDAVTHQVIADWINGQAERYAPKTIKNRHGFLYALMQAAVEDELIPRNPCARSRLPEGEQEEIVFLDPDEYLQLLEYVPAKDRLLVQLIAATGMRWGEVSALKPTDLDVRAQTVRVSRAWKHSQARGWYVSAPKTKSSRRTISLPDSLIPDLRAAARQSTEWLFVNSHGQPWRHTRFNEDVWKPAVRLANGLPAFEHAARRNGPWDRVPAEESIGKWPGLHSLRHSHVFWLIRDGVDPLTIQRRLGHRSIQTTLNVYGHLSPDMLLIPAQAIDRILGSPGTTLATVGHSN